MAQTVLITGTGRPYALGFNLVRRYLEQGDTVLATIRRPSKALEKLQKEYPDHLHILTMDLASSASVQAAAEEAKKLVSGIELVINNATKAAVNVGAVGPLRVIKSFLPLLKNSRGTALIVNISSEAGSIGHSYRTFYLATKTLHNYFKNDPSINIICIHPGWIRTNPGNTEAPLDPYEHAETLRLLFESRRNDKEGPVFITDEGEPYPW